MEIQGRVIAALPMRSGISTRGEWRSQEFVIETHESYPKKMVFNVFGAEHLQRFNIQVGQEITVFFNIDAREYNKRWFNSITAWDVKSAGGNVQATRQVEQNTQYQQPTAPPQQAYQQPSSPAPAAPQSDEDYLPF